MGSLIYVKSREFKEVYPAFNLHTQRASGVSYADNSQQISPYADVGGQTCDYSVKSYTTGAVPPCVNPLIYGKRIPGSRSIMGEGRPDQSAGYSSDPLIDRDHKCWLYAFQYFTNNFNIVNQGLHYLTCQVATVGRNETTHNIYAKACVYITPDLRDCDDGRGPHWLASYNHNQWDAGVGPCIVADWCALDESQLSPQDFYGEAGYYRLGGGGFVGFANVNYYDYHHKGAARYNWSYLPLGNMPLSDGWLTFFAYWDPFVDGGVGNWYFYVKNWTTNDVVSGWGIKPNPLNSPMVQTNYGWSQYVTWTFFQLIGTIAGWSGISYKDFDAYPASDGSVDSMMPLEYIALKESWSQGFADPATVIPVLDDYIEYKYFNYKEGDTQFIKVQAPDRYILHEPVNAGNPVAALALSNRSPQMVGDTEDYLTLRFVNQSTFSEQETVTGYVVSRSLSDIVVEFDPPVVFSYDYNIGDIVLDDTKQHKQPVGKLG